MADTTEVCQKLLEKAIEGEARTSTSFENLKAINTMINGVTRSLSDLLIKVDQNQGQLTQTISDLSIVVDQHQLQLKAEIDAFMVEQSQKEQNMEERLNQSLNVVTTASS